MGHKTGVLDADVYGYSIPHMLGVHQRPVAVDDGERAMIVPPVRGDLKVMSIGFFLDENTPVMWRGPMLHRALEQFLSDVHWGELDTLVVDMPPGTGDVAISLGQLLPRAEAVVVTTPHRASQQVAVRAAQMARKTNMRLLGVAENMSYLTREDGSREELFGSGGGDALAAEVEAPLLGRIPSTRGSAHLPTRASRSSSPIPRRRSRGRSSPSPRPLPTRSASRRRHRQASPARPQLSTEDVHGRLRALGFEEREAGVLADHFLDAEERGRTGHGLTRLDWLATLPDLDPAARPARVVADEGYERWEGRGALGYLTLAAIVDSQLAAPPRRARVVVAQECFPTGVLGYWAAEARRRRARGSAHGHVTAPPPPSRRRPAAHGTNALTIAIPSSDGAHVVADLSMGKVTYGDVIAGKAARRSSCPSGASRRTRLSRSPSGSSCSSTPWQARATARCSSSRDPRPTPCRRFASAPAAYDFPATASSRT